MPIIITSPSSTEAALLASDVIDCASIEVQDTFSNGPGRLLSYVDRVQRDIVRRRPKGWDWLRSATKQFVTRVGQTKYWIGATGSDSDGEVDTALNLTNVYEVLDASVLSRTGYSALAKSGEPPLSWSFQAQDGSYSVEEPRWFRSDRVSPNLLEIYPSPSRTPEYLLVPTPPHCTTTVSGALAARTYFVKVTFVDAAGNEGLASSPATRIYVPANSLLVVKAPQPAVSQSGSGVSYNQYKVYASETEGDEQLQSSATAITADWTEPGTGLIAGAAVPDSNELEPLGGWVIQFRYMPKLTTLTAESDSLLIPARYLDVVCAGVCALAAQFNASGPRHDKKASDWAAIYEAGIRSMVRDQNPWTSSNLFIRPDPGLPSSVW